MANEEKQYFFDKPENVKLVIYSLYGSCAFLLLLDFIIHRHITHHWEGLLGFYAIYGLIGCIVIVLSSKILRYFVERGENFYGDEDLDKQNGQGR